MARTLATPHIGSCARYFATIGRNQTATLISNAPICVMREALLSASCTHRRVAEAVWICSRQVGEAAELHDRVLRTIPIDPAPKG